MLPEIVPLTERQRALLAQIQTELARVPVELNKYRSNSGLGRSMAFSIVHKRGEPTDLCREETKVTLLKVFIAWVTPTELS